MSEREDIVLLVDDEDVIVDHMSGFLEPEGFIVRKALSVNAARQQLTDGKVSVVVTDLIMPDEDGFALNEFIMEKFPHIPVIIQTGFGEKENLLKALRGNVFDFLDKPIEKTEFLHSVRQGIELYHLKVGREVYVKSIEAAEREIRELNLKLEAKFEEALAESEARFRAAFDNAAIGMAVVGTDRNLLMVNRALSRLLGFSKNELANKTLDQLSLPDDLDSLKLIWRKLISNELEFVETEHRCLLENKASGWMLMTLSAVKDGFGEVRYAVLQLQDMTERKKTLERIKHSHDELMSTNERLNKLVNDQRRTEDALRESQRQLMEAKAAADRASRSKGEFLSAMSHEIRTPMTALIGTASLLETTELTAEQRELAETVRIAGDNLMTIINDILDYSKVESGKLKLESHAFEIPKLCEEIRSLFSSTARQKKIELLLHSNLDEELSQVVGDRMRIQQILANYCSNALKFTSRGTIQLDVHGKREGARVKIRFSVKDTGIGIPPDKIGRLFEPFTQAEESTARIYGGSGLGLAIAKKLAQLMNGQVGCESELGKGSTFWLELVLDISRSEKAGTEPKEKLRMANSSEPSSSAARKTILIVDDVEANAAIGAKMAQKCGYATVTASNGEEAIRAVENQPVDIVFMDCQMDVMDGYEATRRLRLIPEGKDLPIIAMTALVTDDNDQKCYAAGMDDFLPKPVRYSDFQAKVQRWSFGREQGRRLDLRLGKEDPLKSDIIDKLRELALDDPDLLIEQIQTFFSKVEHYQSKMQELAEMHDFEGVVHCARSVGASSNAIGAQLVQAVARLIEEHALDRSLTKVLTDLEILSSEYKRVKALLDREIVELNSIRRAIG